MHKMTHEGEAGDGYHVWQCSQCERRLLLRMNPFDKVTVREGDTLSAHAGGRFGAVAAAIMASSPPTPYDRNFLDQAKIDWGN